MLHAGLTKECPTSTAHIQNPARATEKEKQVLHQISFCYFFEKKSESALRKHSSKNCYCRINYQATTETSTDNSCHSSCNSNIPNHIGNPCRKHINIQRTQTNSNNTTPIKIKAPPHKRYINKPQRGQPSLSHVSRNGKYRGQSHAKIGKQHASH